MKILVIDVGGSHIKIRSTEHTELIKIFSGPEMTARKMVAAVKKVVAGWDYEVITIGYPGPVIHNKLISEPHNLGRGWVGFNFQKAFSRPVKIVNDAAMQALGSYEGGRMLFLGLGTGLGSALIVDSVLAPLELAHLPYKKNRTYEDYVGLAGLKRLGKKKWHFYVEDVVEKFKIALQVDYVVLGGGNIKFLKKFPRDARPGNNANAFRGGCRLWAEPRDYFSAPKIPRVAKSSR